MFDGLMEQTSQKLKDGEDTTSLPGLIIKARESDPRVAKLV